MEVFMKQLFFALPHEMILRAMIKAWAKRPQYVEGMTYNVGAAGVVLGVPSTLWATVIGSQTFGIEGRDVDFGVVCKEVDDERALFFEDAHVTKYANVVTTCEYKEIGVHAFLALPLWRAELDASEYAAASPRVHCMGADEWLSWKRDDKEAAYRAVGVSLQQRDGSF